MRINRIQLHNFRNFEDKIFDFPAKVAVVIGDNGSGKSSVLQGVRLAAATFLLGLDESERIHIQKEDVRRIDAGSRFVPQKDTFFHAWGELNEEHLEWKRTLGRIGGKTNTKDASPLIQMAERLNEEVNTNLANNVNLPVFCYFGTARLWTESKQRVNLKKKGSRLHDGYGKCLDLKSDRLTPLEWIKSNYYKSLKSGSQTVLLQAILEAISICVPGWSKLEWDEDTDDLAGEYVDKDGNVSFIPLYYLSDGLRTMAGMVAEIAYRCVVLNEHLGTEAVRGSRGIVMIDEIDMHLHPNWQRKVIDDLKTAFPGIQFIVTSHSPFIVQSVAQDELINLDPATAADPNTLGLEEVATEIMGVDNTRSQYYLQYFDIAARYFKLLETAEDVNQEEKINLTRQLDEIEEQFQQDPAYAAFLKLNRVAKLGKE